MKKAPRLLLSLLVAFAPVGAARAADPPTPAVTAKPDTDAQRIADLVIANHILADQGVLDGFGHISFRSVANPKHYFMARAIAPALVTKADIVEFDENSQPIDLPAGFELYSERFIHGEIYRARPDVQSVAHSHSGAVIPFSVTTAPLKALIHVAYFLGAEPAPVFDLRSVEGDHNQMLVGNAKDGAGLAKTLGDRPVVLMRGHGMAVVGGSIHETVFRAVYTQVNAQVEEQALRLGSPTFMNAFEVQRVERIERPWDLWAAQAAADSIAGKAAK
jgi:HCOMODA/2-hydroxy-3-carboxy-muconic semialdehyde decarboxylase